MPLWPSTATMRPKEEHIDHHFLYAPSNPFPHASQAVDSSVDAYIAPLDLSELIQDDYATDPSDAASIADADAQTSAEVPTTIAATATSKPVIEPAKTREKSLRYHPYSPAARTTTTTKIKASNKGPQLEPYVPSDPWFRPELASARYQNSAMPPPSTFTHIESGSFDNNNNGVSPKVRDLPLVFPDPNLPPTPPYTPDMRNLSLPPSSSASTGYTSSGYNSTRTSASPFANPLPLPTLAPVPANTPVALQPALLHSRQPNPYANKPGALDRNIAFLRDRLGFASTVPLSLESIPTHPLGERPGVPLRHLTALAILSSPERVLTLQGIYRALMDRFLYFAKNNERAAWMRSIRHALSLYKQFTNISRAQGESGKGGYWMLDIDNGEGYKRDRKRLNTGDRRARARAPKATAKKAKSNRTPKAKVYSDDEFEAEDGDADFMPALAPRQTRSSTRYQPYATSRRSTRNTRV
ncbi:Winged helix DNA-binding domain-containing protein [Mycena kentingensis (nom. inval.)]|nr:Winged helix DNA-binding domain-containing protein [Mycena kentingensis (nom. inval.)]